MGKLFIIDGAQCICKFGTAPGLLKVNSHQLLVVNHNSRKIATSQELQNTFYPPAFTSCTYNSPYIKACMPAIIQWTDFYKKMRVNGNAYPLLPESKATCAVCGVPCIEIVNHGQIEIPLPANSKNATIEHQTDMDPSGDPLGLSEESPINLTVKII